VPAGLREQSRAALAACYPTPPTRGRAGLRTPGARSAGRSIRRWLQQACALAGGGLTPERWAELVPEQDYEAGLPLGLTADRLAPHTAPARE
jgi:hypothetical protein